MRLKFSGHFLKMQKYGVAFNMSTIFVNTLYTGDGV